MIDLSVVPTQLLQNELARRRRQQHEAEDRFVGSGAELLNIRLKNMLQQEDVGLICGYSQAAICMAERGKRPLMCRKIIQRLNLYLSSNQQVRSDRSRTS